ncbi:kinase-like domain-containing protein [Mycena galericulata]|nr:kinase-like domain-containing protein [Mycena galericulata]
MQLSSNQLSDRRVDPAFSKRNEVEEVWAKFQPWLKACGYMLRPRYHPDWSVPPGTTTLGSESAIPLRTLGGVLDATRISDGAQVVLKFVETVSPDTQISAYLTTEPGAHNHCLPIIELLRIEDLKYSGCSLMVLPRMRDCDSPAFATIGEIVEFIEQVLEGLVFLHSKNIAHGDICMKNIVMDASRMIPGGFHFSLPSLTADGKRRLYPYNGDDTIPHIKSRTQAGPMKYYFIDFGLSVKFSSYETRELVTGECGRLREHIPEISETVPYDPFKVDVCMVGEMLNEEFNTYVGLDFLVPFTCALRHRDPASRPDAKEALALFRDLASKMGANELTTSVPRVWELNIEQEGEAA